MPSSKTYRNRDTEPTKTRIETTATVLADGTMFELVLDSESKRGRLLGWNGHEVFIADAVERNDSIYAPPNLNPDLLRAVRLPTKITPYGSTRALFDEILAALSFYTELPAAYARQLVYTFFASWVIECLPVAPVVHILAPVGSSRTRLLAILAAFYRRPLFLAEANLSVLSCVPRDFRPTCFFDEPELSRRFQRLLHAGSIRGALAARNRRVLDAFSAKVICSQEPLSEPLLASHTLEISLPPACSNTSSLDIALSAKLAEEFQPQLLLYRLKNYGKPTIPKIEVAELSPPMQDVALSLASAIVVDKAEDKEDEKLQGGIIELLRERDDDISILRSMEPESTLLQALRKCVHEDGRQHVLCGELADIANELWKQRGEGQHISPESVGRKLHKLTLKTEPIGSAGNGLKFTKAVCARAHALAREYRIPTLQQTAKLGCPYCEESAAATTPQPPTPSSEGGGSDGSGG